ncbi:SIMPL domain-containing protein [Pseudoponticoccus marisrubri]|uniref:SIMPL domain-containing protein n=1 Tax=Pseudoponticoccus marisrubri TaxID=1685382 RepID=A0A0W7WN74_9RHOB|nr:SIMPL domain-containing protein [Pseudoponticoccus marisrubri]KUF12051.1 hypothetical protein AVJ23_05620 [Pseudoponticoccus marisrubri]
MRILTPILFLLAALPALAQPLPSITVSGEARVTAVPDMASVSVGARFAGDTAVEAMNRTSEALDAVIARLADEGIAPRDMQTAALRVSERVRYDRESGIDIHEGFEASNTLTVRVRDLDRLGPVLGAVLGDGANTLSGLNFGLQDPGPLEDEARRRAVADAIHKAGLYAEAAGVPLGRLIEIRDTAQPMVPSQMMRSERMVVEAAPADVPIAAGEIEARAEVTLVYALGD